jgi:hypothetical protein
MTKFLSPRKFRLVIAVLLTALLPVSLVASGIFDELSTTASSSQSPSVRKLEINEKAIPKGVIEIVSVKNLQGENFPEGFEVEVKNISDKPIYGIHFVGVLEEARQIYGTPILFDLVYGASRLKNPRALAQEEDIPLHPRESVVLKPWALHVKGILMQAEKDLAFATLGRSRVVLVMRHTNFGDGTGYVPGGFYPVSRSSTGYAPGGFYPISRSSLDSFIGLQKGLFTKNIEKLGLFATSSDLIYLNLNNYFSCTGCLRGTGTLMTEGCGEGCEWTSFSSGGGDDPCQDFSDGSYLCGSHWCQSWNITPCTGECL